MNEVYTELARLTEDWDTPATTVQRQAAALRYGVARQLGNSGTVVDVACGTGFGIDHLAAEAGVAVGGDLTFENLRRATSRSAQKRWLQLDAQALPLRDGSADVVTCFEAIYYMPSIPRFLAEAHRVLRPGGRLLVTFPNPQRPGFNPSPGSHLYPGVNEFTAMCEAAGLATAAYGAFSWKPEGLLSLVLDRLRRILTRLRLMPSNMAMRGLLKRLAYRNVAPLTPLEPMSDAWEHLHRIDTPAATHGEGGKFLVIYGIATR